MARYLTFVRSEYPSVWPQFSRFFEYYFVRDQPTTLWPPVLDDDRLYTVFGSSSDGNETRNRLLRAVGIALLLVLVAVGVVYALKKRRSLATA